MSNSAIMDSLEFVESDCRGAAINKQLDPVYVTGSSEARNSATVAISSRATHLSPRDQGFEHLLGFLGENFSPESVWPPAPRHLPFTRIFLPFSSLSHVRANERNAALLAAYTLKPGKPFTEAFDPVMKIDPPSLNSGNAF